MSEATWIEFHDTYIQLIEMSEAGLRMALRAVVHTHPNGSAPYSGWQEHELLFRGFSLTCTDFCHGEDVDLYLADGTLELDGVQQTALLPSNTTIEGAVRLTLTPCPNFQPFVITARSLTTRSLGTVAWERELPPGGNDRPPTLWH